MREVLLVCAASGICAMDTTAAWQVMISQPLVASSVAGLLTGEVNAGVIIGILLQLLWSGSIPVGARPMPDAPVASFAGVWFASALLESHPAFPSSAAYLAGILAALAVSLVGRQSVRLERELNRRLFQRFRERLRRRENVGPERVQLLSVSLAFARGFLVCLAAVALLRVASGYGASFVLSLEGGCNAVLVVVGALGVGVLFNVFVRRAGSRLVAFGAGVLFALLVRAASGLGP